MALLIIKFYLSLLISINISVLLWRLSLWSHFLSGKAIPQGDMNRVNNLSSRLPGLQRGPVFPWLFIQFNKCFSHWKTVMNKAVKSPWQNSWPGRVYIVLGQGSPTPRPWTGTSPWPVRNWAAQQEVTGGWAREASSVFTAAPHCSHYHLNSASCQISGGIRFS